MPRMRVGIDTGGTFTDLIALDPASGAIRTRKVLSASAGNAPTLPRLLQDLVGDEEIETLGHGTTTAINALLENKTARAGLLITRGFRAVYEARGWLRPADAEIVDLRYRKPAMLVPQRYTSEVDERIGAAGEVLEPLNTDQVAAAVEALASEGVVSIGICFLFSFLNPAHELAAEAVVRTRFPDLRVCRSSAVLPTIREYRRLSTVAVDACIGPVLDRHLERLVRERRNHGGERVRQFVMQSDGGLTTPRLASRHPVRTLLSGPAAGAVAAARIAADCHRPAALAVDMGGTSTDLSIVRDGHPLEAPELNIDGQDIGTPGVDLRTIGAGGGTLIHVDASGLLKLGPGSAGADPGPACYGLGGGEPTVTDAHAILGTLGTDNLLGGCIQLSVDRARRALAPVAERVGLGIEDTAAGALRILVNDISIQARRALEDHAVDPRSSALLAFGGAGPLHAALLAEQLQIESVIVPLYPGLASAMGLILGRFRHLCLRSYPVLLESTEAVSIDQGFRKLEAEALVEVGPELPGLTPGLHRQVELRYLRQGFELVLDVPDSTIDALAVDRLRRRFAQDHVERYGYGSADDPMELVGLRVACEAHVLDAQPRRADGARVEPQPPARRRTVIDPRTGRGCETRVYRRDGLAAGDGLDGPAIIEQIDATTWIPRGFQGTVDASGNLIMTQRPGRGSA